ncbi:MAG: DUF1501 domain-containing protein [Bacteroidota bacterium]
MDHHHAHDHHHAPVLGRHGSRLEDGLAHEADHDAWTRRDFLLRMGLASAGVGFMLGQQPVQAFGQAPVLQTLRASGTDRVLVLIQLRGGNDALNTVVPFENDVYYRERPTIAIPKTSVLRLDDQHGLHPALASLMPLWDSGHMAVALNTGYERSSRSHFAGTVNWVTGNGRMDDGSMQSFTTGVWGRYLSDAIDNLGAPLENPLAVRLGGPVALFQSSKGNLGVSLGDASFVEQIAERGFYDADDARLNGRPYGRPIRHLRQVANASLRYVTSVQEAAQRGTNLAAYPNSGFADNLAASARLIRGGLGAYIVSVSIGSFDTHSRQGGTEGRHADLWRTIADGVAAFLDDLAQDGLDERVAVMTFSEFGRTLGENGNNGTDHGAGASTLLFGRGLQGGLYGRQSDLVTELYGGDPAPTMDFRSLYATLLQDWFGVDGEEVDALLGAPFERQRFVAAPVRVSTDPAPLPTEFTLAQNYPNPFNPVTTIAFTLDEPALIRLDVFDAQGRRVRTLAEGFRLAGPHTVTFDGTGLPSGVYHYQLRSPAGTRTHSMTLLK